MLNINSKININEIFFIKHKINYLKPILKWVGSKTQIIDNIINEFPNTINDYHEIFLGGGSVLLALLQNIEVGNIKLTGSIYAYDINEPLINLYKNIQNNPKEIIEETKKLTNDYNNICINLNKSKESYYYWCRNYYNKLDNKNSILGSAYFIFLNKTCFRGMYRESINGFNVPFGNYLNPEIINEIHINKITKLIKNVKFIHSDFKQSFKNIGNNSFIYLDPPYVPENKKSFVGYNINGFTLENHIDLFELCKNNKFLMSNSDTKLIHDYFKDYNIKTISCKRSINVKTTKKKTNEVLIFYN